MQQQYTEMVYNPYSRKWIERKTPNKPRKQVTEIANYLTSSEASKENDPNYLTPSKASKVNDLPAPISSTWLCTKPIPHTISKPELCAKTPQLRTSSTSFTPLALTSNANSSAVKKTWKEAFHDTILGNIASSSIIKQSKPEIRSKIHKGCVFTLKNTIANRAIYCFNYKKIIVKIENTLHVLKSICYKITS